MKRLLTLAVCGLSLALPPAYAEIDPRSAATSDTVDSLALGTEVPFPFGTEIPFPWESIEGVWEVQDREIDAYFSFQVQHDEMGVKVLKVLHVDRATRQAVGEGAGFANAEQKIVRAVMRGSGFNYLIFVRVFKDLRIREARMQTATVLTIRALGTPDGREQHYILRKVSNSPLSFR